MGAIEFPSDFLWGAATAAYQVEGAPRADGKGPSIWDVFLATPGRSASGDTGEIACDHYHRWREDVALMRELGLRSYRFSVSWPRVQPTGRGAVHGAGLDFYDRLVDALLAAQIVPCLTLYHWDLPAALQMELGGWLHGDLPHLFADYAEQVARRLGDRVPLWLTLNEPWVVVEAGYVEGAHAPGIRDRTCRYRVAHHLIRAHAYAAARVRAVAPPARVSFALNAPYSYPAGDNEPDRAAAERAMEGFAGWFADPLHFGDYPAVLRERLGPLLPEFTPADAALLRGSLDFLALNYYFSDVIRHAPGRGALEIERVPQTHRPHTAMNWPVMPEGLCDLLLWLHRRYVGLPIYVTENGAAFDDAPDAAGFVDDPPRIAYLRDHFESAARARAAGVDLRGYYVWSLLDNLEWTEGFRRRFGLVHCDRTTLRRTVKASGRWYARFIATGRLNGG